MKWVCAALIALGVGLIIAGNVTAHVLTPGREEENIGAGLMAVVGGLLAMLGLAALGLTRLARAARERGYSRRNKGTSRSRA